MLPFLAAFFTTAGTAPTVLPPSSDDVSIAKAIQTYIYGRSETLRLRVDSVSTIKLSGEVHEGTYLSNWEVTLRFRAAYTRPEDDPYLAGMLRCFDELRASSDASWVKWAEDEIAKRRSEVLDLITYAQEQKEAVTAYAEIDGSGRIIPETVRLKVPGIEGSHGVQELLKAVPGPEQFEDAGYKYLLSGRQAPGGSGQEQSVTSGGHGGTATPPKEIPGNKGGPSPTPPPTTPVQPAEAIKPTTRRPPTNMRGYVTNRTYLLYWATGMVAVLLAILVAGEVYNQRRKMSGRR